MGIGVSGKQVQFSELMGFLRASLARIPEHRRGDNGHYEIADAGLAALSVFFMQEPSFLAYQANMQAKHGHNNAKSLFGVAEIPSDGQMRNLLDPVDPALLAEPFWASYELLAERGALQAYRGATGSQLVSLDGTQYFSSQKVHCENCRVTLRDGRSYYSHQVLLAVMGAPEQPHVVCLPPEFITPQDGAEKQDCEQQAIKRWVKQHARRFAPWSATVLTDDLHAHQPVCQLLLDHQMHFILTCKPDSHPALYEELQLLERVAGAIGSKTVQRWNGRHHAVWQYRWANTLPIREGPAALKVNWCELRLINQESGEQRYYNAWLTDQVLDETTVVAVAQAGRSRWKVENEGINVLKQRGYHFEHNFGHGDQHLSTVLLSLLLLAFLFHTALDLACLMYHAIRQKLRTRRKFFDDLRGLTTYLYWRSFQHLLGFMYRQLELGPPPSA
jgi:hypothetical protein